MSICIHRPETPGFWTPCTACPCGKEAEAAQEAAQEAQEGPGDASVGSEYPSAARALIGPEIANSHEWEVWSA